MMLSELMKAMNLTIRKKTPWDLAAQLMCNGNRFNLGRI